MVVSMNTAPPILHRQIARLAAVPCAALLVVAAVAPVARADDDEIGLLCGASHVQATQVLHGEWVLQQRAGIAHVGPVAMPLAAVSDTSLVLESYSDGRLLARTPDFSEDMQLEPAFGALDDLPDGLEGWGPDGEAVDIEANADCAWSDMPRYVGSTDYDFDGAGRMRMTLIVHFPNVYFGIGFVQFRGFADGNEFTAQRRVLLTRGTF